MVITPVHVADDIDADRSHRDPTDQVGLGRETHTNDPTGATRRLRRWSGLLAPAKLSPVSKQEIDRYLASLDEPKRSTLEALREAILEIIPEAEQGISYGVPAFRLEGKVVAGFAAFKNHLSYLPHSGSVFPELGDEIAKYKTSSGALQFPIDRPLPKALVRKLIAIKRRQALGR